MPRNGNVKGSARRKAAKAASKRRRRDSDVSSSLDLSSDGGYSALDDVSDSDDNDEDDIVAAEEKHIIKDVVKTKHRHTLGRSPRPAGSSPVTDAAAVAANSSNTVQSEEEDADQEGDDDGDDGDDDDGVEGGVDDDDSSSSSDSDFDLGELDEATLLAIGVNPPHDGDADDAANADDVASWNGISESDANINQSGSGSAHAKQRQVRFAGVPDSDSDDSDSSDEEATHDSTFFPDIFVEQNLLDPAFRREIENESDSSVSSSFWDYAAAFEPSGGHDDTVDDDDFFASVLDQPMPPPSTPAAEATDATLDGYETDSDDDSTEDEAPPQPEHGRRANARYIDSDNDESTDSDSDSKVSVTPQKRRLPRVRRYFFTPRSRRPVAMINPASGKMVIFTPEKRAARASRTTHDDSDNNLGLENDAAAAAELDAQLNALLNGHEFLDISTHNANNGSGMLQSSPLISSSGAVMMSAMISSQTFGDYIQSHNVGPIEAFFPANLNADNLLGDDSDFSGEIFEDEGESNLRIEDFIQFDRNSADGTDPADALFGLVPSQLEADDDFLLGLTSELQNPEDGDDSAAQTPVANSGNNNLFSLTTTGSIDDMLFSSIFDSGGSGLGSLGSLGDVNAGGSSSAPVSRRASIAASSSVGDDDLVGGGVGLGSGLAGFMGLTGLTGLEGIEEEDESALDKDYKDDAATTTTAAAGEDDSDDNALPPLLAHFGKNSDAVSAFRRNQIDKQLIYSNKATAESLAFSGPLNMGTLRGIRNGSLEAVTTPITPPRRPKQRMMMMAAAAAAAARSPLEIIAQKRKASGSVASGGSDNGSGSALSHKRHRSISEVKDLAL